MSLYLAAIGVLSVALGLSWLVLGGGGESLRGRPALLRGWSLGLAALSLLTLGVCVAAILDSPPGPTCEDLAWDPGDPPEIVCVEASPGALRTAGLLGFLFQLGLARLLAARLAGEGRGWQPALALGLSVSTLLGVLLIGSTYNPDPLLGPFGPSFSEGWTALFLAGSPLWGWLPCSLGGLLGLGRALARRLRP